MKLVKPIIGLVRVLALKEIEIVTILEIEPNGKRNRSNALFKG